MRSTTLVIITFILVAYGHSDIKPKGWCGTSSGSQHDHDHHKETLVSSQKIVPFPCAEGKCDDPDYRDDFIAQSNSLMMIVRLYWVVNDNRKTPDEIHKQIDEQVTWLNEAFAPAKIGFNVSGVYISTDKDFEKMSGNDYGKIYRYKSAYTADPTRMMHIYVTDLLYGLLGRATFPWDPDYLTTNGGIILDRDFYGYKHSTLVHEIGHCLGLWHTHHGWENSIRDINNGEIIGCSLCDEHPDIPSNKTGDLCSDTKPTSVNYYCEDPVDKDCNFLDWGRTDYDNFMGYAPDSCYVGFTEQQMARMRCWITESATSLLQDIGCSTNSDCKDNTNCTINTCVNNVCEFTGIDCDSGEPCMTSYCTSKGCVNTPRSCTPTYLVCATGKCDSEQNKCILNTENCQKPNNTLQDCCETNFAQAYCNDESIYNCVCAMDETCCAIYWHAGCTELVKYCSSRDCLKESLPVPQNTKCSTAKQIITPGNDYSYSLATDISNVTCNEVTITESGLWYTLAGKGNDVTVTTCYGITTGRTSIRVFDACGGNCIVWQETSEECGAQTKVSFTASDDETFYIFVAIDPSEVVTVNFYETYLGNMACKTGNFKIMKDTRAVCSPSDSAAFSEVDAEKLCLAQDDCFGFTWDPSTYSVSFCTDPKFAYHPQPGVLTAICQL